LRDGRLDPGSEFSGPALRLRFVCVSDVRPCICHGRRRKISILHDPGQVETPRTGAL